MSGYLRRTMSLARLQILIKGQVQGVGFRPHVYQTAIKLGLTGWVKNNGEGVFIEIQGEDVSAFLTMLVTNLPPLAKIATINSKKISLVKNERFFQIKKSNFKFIGTNIAPDCCICSNCLNELFDPQSRYFLYPFLNCTNCGPRFTITNNVPYDRCQTSMDVFPLCKQCQTEYNDPENRRFHAQPTACANCGPKLSTSIDEIAALILDGKIIALKGLGGYKLICDAKNQKAILNLRTKKSRDKKPFAIMVLNTATANTIVELNENSKKILTSKERPIVLLRRKDFPFNSSPILFGAKEQWIAPGLADLGLMLPYTPLHYLLFYALLGKPEGNQWLNEPNLVTLIVTSANLGGEPLIIEDHNAQRALDKIANKIVYYNRQILSGADDSVVRVVNNATFFIRRARGFVPSPIKLPCSMPKTLAVGGHLKNTFCLTRDDEAFVSQHIGSLNNKATINCFHKTLNHFIKFLGIKPERIAHDLHPDFYTTHFAEEYGIPTYGVQHHHAHLASVAAEHGIQTTPTLGLALDGFGLGLDGQSWGGELFLLENMGFKSLGSFMPLPQPGGEIAAKEPWRMAASVLHLLGKGGEITQRFSEHPEAQLINQILIKKINSPLTSSCGRLFDAVSALLNVQTISNYEGHAAMRLESLVTKTECIANGWQINDLILDMLPTIKALLKINDPVKAANLFHGTLIMGLSEWVLKAAKKTGINTILLAGGCFLNKVLTEGLCKKLTEAKLNPLLPINLPPNDGGLSLGQAWIGGRM